MRSLAVLIPRLVIGGLLAGHGAQKLFGSFGGRGIERTAGFMESLGLRPGTTWAQLAGWSEFGGGILTALGLLSPLGPIAAAGSMVMAWVKVHAGKPLWVTEGGAELPVTNLAFLSAIAIAGPGRLSLDTLLGIRVSRLLALGAVAATAATIVAADRDEVMETIGPMFGVLPPRELEEPGHDAGNGAFRGPAGSGEDEPAASIEEVGP